MDIAYMDRTASDHWAEEFLSKLATEPDARVLFQHRGRVDHAVVEELLGLAETASKEQGDPVSMRKRLINVLVEGLENVDRHVMQEHHATAFALLVSSSSGYRLLMGNALPIATAALLTHRVDILNEMDDSDLKEHYLKLLSNEARTERGGAGLGLLTMARKCIRPMVVHIRPMDERTSLLAMELRMQRA